MDRQDVPRCVAFDCDLTVEHILIECGDFAEVRQNYYDVERLKKLFQEISIIKAFDLLREIGMFCRI